MKIGERIRRARRFAGLSQVQLAESIKVRRSAVSNWESANDIHPTMANLVGIATTCRVSLEWLGTGRGTMSAEDCDVVDVADAELIDVPLERRLLAIFRSLPRHSQTLVMNLLELLASSKQRRSAPPGARESRRGSFR
jgi:transcriptional regulator with XRE-family HTH domain